ncbi:hypothetical protein Tco_0185979 [Tanacetum coccineum]
MSNLTSKSSDTSLVKIEAPKELPKLSLVNESLKKLKFHLARFDNVVKIRTTPDPRTKGEWGLVVFNNEIIPFLKSLKDIFNVFDKDLLNEIMEVQTVFDQMDAAVQQSSVDKQCLEIAKKELLLENDRLLQQIMSQDVLLTVMNSMYLIGESADPDYVPEPIYPEYIPLEDEHEFPAEEQPLPPVDSPTAESPGYVTESDPEEDPEEYEDDETEDGPVDYPMDGGDDGDDDDGDSSGDDADGEDEDDEDEEEEEEEHLAPADSAIVVPVDEPVFPPEGTEPVIPPPSTDITIGARITVRPQTSISLPPEAEVERLLTMTTPSPSPPISLSPPSAGERLARCTAPPAHSSPLLPSSGCPTQIQTFRITSTQALIDAVTAALPSPSLPPLPPSLYIPPPVDRRDDIPESEQPPRKRLYLSTLGSRYEVGESSTARPTRGRGIDYGFVSTVDAEERRQGIRDVGYGIRDTWVGPAEAVPEIAPMTVGEVNTRVTELAELHEHDTQDLYALLEDAQDIWMVEEEAYASREAWAHSIGLSQATHQELQTHRDHVYAHETHLQAHQTQLQLQSTVIQTQHQVHETRFQMQQAELAALRETDRRCQAQMVETLRVIRDMRREMSDMQTELLALREQQRRARQPGPEARIPDHQDASGDADSHI